MIPCVCVLTKQYNDSERYAARVHLGMRKLSLGADAMLRDTES
jgi:hypothetical protein